MKAWHGPDDDAHGDEHRHQSPVLTGAIGGILATVTMTVYRLPIARSLPPTSDFWAEYGPGDSEAGPMVALVLHLAYGAGAGIAYGTVAAAVPETGSDAMQEIASLTLAVAYGVVLSLFGSRVLLGRLLGMDLERDESLVFHVSHGVYALTLGTWVGSRMRAEQ